MMMKYIVCLFLIPIAFAGNAQNRALSKGAILTKKNFSIVDVVMKSNSITAILPVSDRKSGHFTAYRFSSAEIKTIMDSLGVIYKHKTKDIDILLDTKIRHSGSYALFEGLPNEELWLKCWERYFITVNYCIDVYGLGKKLRYPNIDSASFDVKSSAYHKKVNKLMSRLSQKKGMIFYESSLELVLGLLLLNKRDEAIRHEPLEKGENKVSFRQVKKTSFREYKYTAIVVPGEGPEEYGIALSRDGEERCRLAAEWFGKKYAPFVILSGGYCHPFQTRYCEAIEMKKLLINRYNIPEAAIIIDPHARHTTTNFRNAGRYLISYGFPNEKPALLLTTKDQADYIANPSFAQRNLKELGYLPFKALTRISDLEFSFYPVREVMTRDAVDPLDP